MLYFCGKIKKMEKLYQYIEEPPMQLQEPPVVYQRTFRTSLEEEKWVGYSIDEIREMGYDLLSELYEVDIRKL